MKKYQEKDYMDGTLEDYRNEINGIVKEMFCNSHIDFSPVAEVYKKEYDAFIEAGFSEWMAFEFTKASMIHSVVLAKERGKQYAGRQEL